MEIQSIPPVIAEHKVTDWKAQCAAIIPCFNEATAIAGVVRDVRMHVPTVLVVDDGSTDSTAQLAQNAGATLVRHATNRGKGAALRVGFQHLCDLGFEWALTLDGDGQHAAAEIPRFFECADRTAAALVIGNRMGQADRMPWLRRRVNRWMSTRLSKLTQREIMDSQCGFRLVKLAVLERVRLNTNHFEIESELLTTFAKAGERIESVPVEAIYKFNHSKIRSIVDTVRWFRWWWRQ